MKRTEINHKATLYVIHGNKKLIETGLIQEKLKGFLNCCLIEGQKIEYNPFLTGLYYSLN